MSQLSAPPASGRDISLDYLRTTLTLLVIAHHSALAYTTYAFFDLQTPFNSTAPVVDARRWAFFDYATNFNDVFFMSLMFFISGLFIYPAWQRHGTAAFVRDRLLRLGLPFVFAVVVLMPVAFYASWSLSAHREGFWDFYRILAGARFAAGPPWFIWLLLLFNILATLVARFFSRPLTGLGRWLQRLQDQPVRGSLAIFGLAALVYLPPLLRYGASEWTVLLTSPLAFQTSRFGLYALWFAFGVAVGVPGLRNGLLAREGQLARRWPRWLLACAVLYNALWFGPQWAAGALLAPATRTGLTGLLWLASGVASCFALLALFQGRPPTARPWLNALTRSAYVMYLVHYVYLTWLQHLLLGWPVAAAGKFGVVFVGTTLLSWLTAQLLFKSPALRSFL